MKLFSKNIQRNVLSEFEKQWQILNNMPRYIKSSTNILGKNIDFVDACTFIGGYNEIFRDEIYKFTCTNETPKIIDCGANIGLSIIYFKKLFPLSEIIGIEADPNIFSVLKSNISSFSLQNIELINKAVWINNDEIQFSLEGGYSGRIALHSEENKVKIHSVRLKDFLNSHIDFLKIDIEGAENDVIFDCAENLGNIDKLFLEYHSHIDDKQRLGDILNLLTQNNFKYQITNAFSSLHPFIEIETMVGMDLQVNIFAYKR